MTMRLKKLNAAIVPVFTWFANFIRYAGTNGPQIDCITDEMERAITGDRPEHPLHNQRTLLLR